MIMVCQLPDSHDQANIRRIEMGIDLRMRGQPPGEHNLFFQLMASCQFPDGVKIRTSTHNQQFQVGIRLHRRNHPLDNTRDPLIGMQNAMVAKYHILC